MTEKKISIIGAGFSGLSLAHECLKRGFAVDVYEARNGPGGMIMSPETPFGFYETAANSFLGTTLVEKFLQENQVAGIIASAGSKKRYIYRGHPRKWPLRFTESFSFIFQVLKSVFRGSQWRRADAGESIQSWGRRVLGKDPTEWILEPALQGIYAGDLSRLSAELIFAPKMKSQRRPMISGPRGMGKLMQDLQRSLEVRGAQFYFERNMSAVDLESIQHPVVLAVPARVAATLLSEMQDPAAKSNGEVLMEVEMLPLISATVFYQRPPQKYLGFGILFPRRENIRALGVLMNSLIFERGFDHFTETWIFGGAKDSAVINLSDDEIEKIIESESQKVFGEKLSREELRITRWPQALPHYTVDWLQSLSKLRPMKRVSLHGNYLGNLGLSRILEKSIQLAAELETQWN